MARKKSGSKREVTPVPKYGIVVLSRFANRMMVCGKKSTSLSVVYEALDFVKEKSGQDSMAVFTKALENVTPVVEVKSRRVGGATYQVPVEIRDTRREALAMRWIITAARSRHGKSMGEKLSAELLDAFNATGTAFKKKEDTHKMAEANKAFTHYRW